jgi:hypothetical protein
MPLPQPKLDDKTFDVLVEESTKLIPRYAPDWTDHNRHDPGITLVELFGWLTEMQQFYLDAVGPESYLKFLKLLGTRPQAAIPARTEINFRLPEPPVSTHVHIPLGSKLTNSNLAADHPLIFETASTLLALPLQLKRILSSTLRGLKDNTGANKWDGLSYFAFGEDAEADSRIYLGFDQPFPSGEQIALTFDLIEDYEVARGKHGSEDTLPLPSGLVIWEYYNEKKEWVPLEIVAAIDRIVSRLEQAEMASRACCFGAFDKLLGEIQNESAFKALSADASQSITQAINEARGLSDVRRFLFNPRFLMAKGDNTLMLSQSGRLFFKAPSDMGQYEGQSLIESDLFWLRGTVRQAGFELAPRVDSISINTIDAIQRDTVSETISFSSSGEPQQTFVANSYLATFATSLVQVRERDGRWKDWEAVQNLNSSRPNDRQYIIVKNTEAGTATLTFGDGQHGRIPGKGDDQVRLISYLPDFEEEQKLGSSNGLPGQSFILERQNVTADSLMLQVNERVVPPRTSTETMDVSCLLSFSRTTTLKNGSNFEVKVSLKAKADLCNVSLREELRGDLQIVKTDLPSDEGRGKSGDEPTLVFETGRMLTESTREWTYTLVSTKGGSIGGEVEISMGRNCPSITEESPISIIEITSSEEDWRWRDWVRVEDFDASGPNDPHFVFDSGSSTIRFGDGINGDIPQAAGDASGDTTEGDAAKADTGEVGRNVRIISLQTCEGESGNVRRDKIGEFANTNLLPANLRSWRLSNVVDASGGRAAELLADAQARARADLRTQYQAVTSADFEFLAINTPGLRVARAKAIPCFSAAGKLDPQAIPDGRVSDAIPLPLSPRAKSCASRASVTVVVLPYSISAKPVPSENFLLNVCRHLDRHRLITTQVEVVAPNYVQVSVQATVLLQAGFEVEPSRQAIINALNRFLRPIPEPGDRENQGWPFGRTVFKSEIYELIEKVAGVDCVEKVSLTAQGSGAARDANGNITITPTSVVYSGNHQVDVVTPELDCRSGT